ncbi:MAG: deoxyribose-phosphate aldolase, partial [Cytophagaceae bacterium]|nr:deoxyribose-phosphate aldolase [Cytophagaceae bacterium]
MKPINEYIEHTLLQPTITDKDIDRLVAEAKEYHFSWVCVPSFWVKRAKREIDKDSINLVTVIGFPLGYQMTETKIEEIKIAIALGADELDVVMNISAFKIKMDWFKIELAKCSKLIHENQKILKVIIETAYLEHEEIIRACKICADAGVDFVKTSTGFAPEGAQKEHITLMRKHLPAQVGIKASGGIKTLA